jgi:hypothetical protein
MRQLYTALTGINPSNNSIGNHGTPSNQIKFPKNDSARGAQQLANRNLGSVNYARVPLESEKGLKELGFIFA